MKSKAKFISRMLVLAVAGSFALTAQAQTGGDATTGDDAHPGADSPFLRRKASPAASAAAAQAKLSQKDQKFLSQIAAGGIQAVKDSEMAEQQGGAGLKSVAARIVNERGRSNKELVDLAKKKGLGLATDKIRARSMGKANFDKQFVHTMSRDLEEDSRLLQAAASSSDDKDVKAWAAKTLPMVRQHVSALKSIKS